MSYNFTFDLSRLSHAFFKEIAEFSEQGKINEKISGMAKTLVSKFHVNEITGLPVSDSLTIIEDLININIKNSILREDFSKANKRALFLPHCCRKYMDSRCQATFNTETASYECRHCSQDCMVHQATLLAAKENYDIYVLPGGSGVRKIFQKTHYDGVVGIACTDELKLAISILDQYRLPAQMIPLTKNGCSATQFNMETLKEYMIKKETQNDKK